MMVARLSPRRALSGVRARVFPVLRHFVRSECPRYPLRGASTPGDLVWSMAMPAGLADIYPRMSTRPTFPVAAWLQRYVWAVNRHVKDVVKVYVPGDCVDVFVDRVLPRLTKQIVLVIGDSDRSSLAETLGPARSPEAFLDDDGIVAIFAQNLRTLDDRAFPIPIGVDFHTIHNEAEGQWGMPGRQTPSSQEADLIRIRNNAPDFARRELAVYTMFSLATNRGERLLCLARLNQVPIARIEGTGIARETVWTRMARFQFVASPRGGGYDCHRTWEALALGCVPIVKRVPAMSPMFRGLPVWEVHDYVEVTEETARRKACEVSTLMARGQYDWEKLKISWWRRHMDEAVDHLTSATFRPRHRDRVSL